MNNLGLTFGEDAESRGSAPIIRETSFPSMFHKSSIQLPCKLSNLVFVCLTISMYLTEIGIDDYIQWFSGRDMVAINYPDNLSLLPQRRDQLQKCPQLRFLLAKSHSLRIAKGHPSPRPKWRVLLPRRSSRLSGGVGFDIVRDLFFFLETSAQGN